MNKWWKYALYITIILLLALVFWLMFGNTNSKVEISTSEDTEVLTWEEVKEIWSNNAINYGDTDTFEEDVMKDLEWFFWNNNGYEDVEWEYWFTSTEAE